MKKIEDNILSTSFYPSADICLSDGIVISLENLKLSIIDRVNVSEWKPTTKYPAFFDKRHLEYHIVVDGFNISMPKNKKYKLLRNLFKRNKK